jgi:hypothetical protein
LKTRRLFSVLVLATPWNPPSTLSGDPKADGRVVVVVVVVVVVTPPGPRTPGAPGPIASPARMNFQRPCFVIGSLYARRRNFPLTSTSSEAGSALPLRLW